MTPGPSPVTAVVAVDGPSGAGKSSVSRGVARALGLQYLDTGAMYRAMTWAALRDGIDLTDTDAVARTSASVRLRWSCDPDESVIEVDGLDVSRAIREESVTSTVSLVAAEPRTRAVLVELQRGAVAEALAHGQGIVVEGRDIGSVVLPDADLKVWLVADPAVRAARRAAEDVAAGRLPASSAEAEPVRTSTEVAAPAVDAVAADLARRDAADAGRAASPTTQAADAVVVDATDLGLAEVIARVVQLVHERTSS